MTDDRPGAGSGPHGCETGAEEPAVGDLLRLCEAITAHSHEVRADAERTLARARSLYGDGDGRATIAVSACRDALDTYHSVVIDSLRRAYPDGGFAEVLGSDDAPGPASAAPEETDDGSSPVAAAPITPAGVRGQVARALASAGVAIVVALTGWVSAPTISLAVSPSQWGHDVVPAGPVVEGRFGVDDELAAARSSEPVTAGSPRVAAAARERAGHADRNGEVRRLLASALPDADVVDVAGQLDSAGAKVAALTALRHEASLGSAVSEDSEGASERPAEDADAIAALLGAITERAGDVAGELDDDAPAPEEVEEAELPLDEEPGEPHAGHHSDAPEAAGPAPGDAAAPTESEDATDDQNLLDEARERAGDGDDGAGDDGTGEEPELLDEEEGGSVEVELEIRE